MAAAAAAAATTSGDDIYFFKIMEARGLDTDKKDLQLYVKAKCVGTKQSLKTKIVDGNSGKPEWKEELQFTLNPSKVRKMSERIIEFKVMCKALVMDDCIGSFEVALDAVPSPFAESWVPLERKKKPRGELRIMTHVQRAADGDKYSFEAKYQMGKEIGRGGFSVVYEATNKETGSVVAVKVIDKKKQDDEQLVLLQREISIMKKLDHPNIVKLYDVYDEEKTISLVIEFISGGELYDEIVKRGSFTEEDACTVIKQVLSATAYLHANGIAHRDLKPENLLLNDVKTLEVKIADFGLSKDFTMASAMTTCCGSPSYVAPEVLTQGVYNDVCDIWSIGVILYVLLSGYLPFYAETQDELFDKILSGQFSFRNKVWNDVSPLAKDLITKMLTLDEHERPSAAQCLQHDWFKTANPTKQLGSLGSLRDLRAGVKPRTL